VVAKMKSPSYAGCADAKANQQTEIAVNTQNIKDGEKYHTGYNGCSCIEDILALQPFEFHGGIDPPVYLKKDVHNFRSKVQRMLSGQ
jgi:hypothetical protein